MATLVLTTIVLSTTFASPLFTAQAQDAGEGTEHGPILIEGDADLCDPADLEGGVDTADGIVNCDTANGTAAAPYRIAGWRIAMAEDTACDIQDRAGAGGCDLPPSCRDATVVGLIAVCDVGLHLVIEDTLLEVPVERSALVGVHIRNAAALTIKDLTFRGEGPAVRVVDSVHDEQGSFAVTLAGLDAAPLPDSSATQAASERALVESHGSDLQIVDSALDASGRPYGIQAAAVASPERDDHRRLAVINSTIGGASTWGVGTAWTAVRLVDNTFRDNGIPALAVRQRTDMPVIGGSDMTFIHSGAAHLRVFDLPLEVVGNTFSMWANGLVIDSTGAADLTQNRFLGGVQGSSTRQVVLHSMNESCPLRFRLNDIGSLTYSVMHSGFDCSLDAKRNFWSNAGGPQRQTWNDQVQGRVEYDPWLRLPLDQLAVASITIPEEGAERWGKTEIRGTVTSPEGQEVVRVEHTRTQEDWQGASRAIGLDDWRIPLDLSEEPLGPMTVWVRACGEVECGPAAKVTFTNVDPPTVPIALLSVTPRVAAVGETVRLDAGASYSPQGTPLEAYRFYFGDGRSTEWQTGPTVETAYDHVGTFPATLEVRDTAGRVSSNPASATLHVRDAPGASSLEEDTPAPPAVWLAGALLVLVALARDRPTGRRPS